MLSFNQLDRARARVRRTLRSSALIGLAVLLAVLGVATGVDALAGSTTRVAPLERAVPAPTLASKPEIAAPAPVRKPNPGAAPRKTLAAVRVPKPGPLPAGVGMWIWQPERAQGGNVRAIVAKAKRVGLTHIYVRTGSSWQGFHGRKFLAKLLPIAHANAIRVYGWDFPSLRNVTRDVNRGLKAINYSTRGHRLDGFVPDLETPSEGTHSTGAKVASYTRRLREGAGRGYPLIGCVPRPSPYLLDKGWPYKEAIQHMSAVAPMVYWLNRQPGSDVAGAIKYLRRFDKPIIPVGQAYDGGPEGGRPGPPPPREIRSFMVTARRHGALGVSFWSWQHASGRIWKTIDDVRVFGRSRAGGPAVSRHTIATVQRSLRAMGYPVPVSARWDPMTAEVLRVLQRSHGLRPTGRLDGKTLRALESAGLQLPTSLRRER